MSRFSLKLARAPLLTIALVFLFFTQQPETIFGAIVGCRGDPIVFLSNGSIIKVTAIIETSRESVSSVIYTLHVPEGTTVERVVYNGNLTRDKEQVVVTGDAPPDTYLVDTIVWASSETDVTVTAGVKNITDSVQGVAGKHLLVSLVQPEAGTGPILAR